MSAAVAAHSTSAVFVEIGAVALVLAALARVAARFGFTAIPLYLLAGLAVGEGGVLPLDVSRAFIHLVAEIGVLLLLLSLGLEYTSRQLRDGLRLGWTDGVVDALVNFTPGLAAGLILGWRVPASVLLGGVTWVSSSGIVAKVITDLGWTSNPETPTVLNILVMEDLAMAVFLPIASAFALGHDVGDTAATIALALVSVGGIVVLAFRVGERLSGLLHKGGDEQLLLAVFGLTLIVGGLAQRVSLSPAVGAFLVGLALSGPVQARAGALIAPLRDLSAAMFFVFFSLEIDPTKLVRALVPAATLAAVGAFAKAGTGWLAATRAAVGRRAALRASSALIARGEFSIVMASLGVDLRDGERLRAVAAAVVLLTAIVGPIAARAVDAPEPRP